LESIPATPSPQNGISGYRRAKTVRELSFEDMTLVCSVLSIIHRSGGFESAVRQSIDNIDPLCALEQL
jgi:hypothetical protein